MPSPPEETLPTPQWCLKKPRECWHWGGLGVPFTYIPVNPQPPPNFHLRMATRLVTLFGEIHGTMPCPASWSQHEPMAYAQWMVSWYIVRWGEVSDGVCFLWVPPKKSTWQWKILHLKMYFLLNGGIFHCYDMLAFSGVEQFVYQDWLGDGFKDFGNISPFTWGRWCNLWNSFQVDWNHKLVGVGHHFRLTGPFWSDQTLWDFPGTKSFSLGQILNLGHFKHVPSVKKKRTPKIHGPKLVFSPRPLRRHRRPRRLSGPMQPWRGAWNGG